QKPRGISRWQANLVICRFVRAFDLAAFNLIESLGTCHFKGSIDGSPEGEVVFLTTNGSFVSVAEADWTVDEKSAIGGLKGLKGKGGYKHPIGASYSDPTPIWLEYTL
ncbi:hypothetical protein FRC09_008306, partial [Ceratobasidium sp. 395]